MPNRTEASFERKKGYVKRTDHLDGFESRGPIPITVQAAGMVFRCVLTRSYWGGLQMDLAQLEGALPTGLEKPVSDKQKRAGRAWQRICVEIRTELAQATGRPVSPVYVERLDLEGTNEW